MQSFKAIVKINESVKVQIEGVGTVRQIEIAEKLFTHGKINLKTKNQSGRILLSNDLLNMATNDLGLYPKEF